MVLACFSFWAECCPNLARNMPSRFIAGGLLFLYDFGMEKMLETLKQIGLPADEIIRVTTYYGPDVDGLTQYVLYMRAMFDDRREYVD